RQPARRENQPTQKHSPAHRPCLAHRVGARNVSLMVDENQDLLDWLSEWGRCVAAVDFDTAATLFDPEVVGFGTRADVATGIGELRQEQWGQVWPNITEFAFHVDQATAHASYDGTLGTIWTTWSSKGRQGRATVVLHRPDHEA